MNRYASETQVSSGRSREEIEKTLTKYGADQFIYGWDNESAIIGFRMNGRQVKFTLPLPARDADEFNKTAKGKTRPGDAARKSWEKATRQRWRALALVIKAKLEAVESGISVFDSEFLANISLPNGTTAGDFLIPQIAQAYETGKMPLLLPLPKGRR